MEGRARRMILVLIGAQAADAIACAIPLQIIKDDLARLGVPERIRPVIPIAKGASALGLALGLRHRRVGALATTGLLVYFVLAIGAHVRLRDEAWRYVSAIGMLLWSVRAWKAFRPVAAGA